MCVCLYIVFTIYRILHAMSKKSIMLKIFDIKNKWLNP